MRIKLITIVLVTFSFAQSATNSDSCPGMPSFLVGGQLEFSNPKGMQLQLDYPSNETDLSIFPSLSHTVNISGIIDSVVPVVTDSLRNLPDTNACVEYERNGKKNCFYGIGYVDSTDLYTHHAVRHVHLRNFNVYYEKESPMSLVIDSSWIYYPEDIELHAGDSIFIKGYSALFDNAWSEDNMCKYNPVGMVLGEYYIFPKKQSLITPTPHTVKNNIPKALNRDASGRCLNGNKSRLIRY